MKILHIISGDLWGGAESLVYGIIRETAQNPDHEVSVLLFNHGILEKRLKSAGIGIKIVDENSMSQLSLLLKAFAYIRTLKPDIIHTHKHKENVVGSLASLVTRTPSVRTAHGDVESDVNLSDGFKFLYKLLNVFTGRTIQKKIIAVSRDLHDKLEKQYPASKIVTIPNGIILKKRSNDQLGKKQKKDKINIAIICRLVPVKRVDIFLAMAQKLSLIQPDRFHFTIFGDGPLDSSLKNLSREYGVSDNVTFMGFVPDMAIYFPKIDFVVITSDHEGLPMNLLESVAHGIPIVSHDVGDISKVLCDGTCGVILNSQDPKEFATAIYNLANDIETIDSYTRSAFENVKNNYSLRSTTEQYIDLYYAVIQ